MKLVLYIANLLVIFASFGQEVNTQLLNPDIRIGEQATLVFSLTYEDPSGEARIGWPQFSNDLTDDIEIIDKTIDYDVLVDSINSIYKREQKLFLTAFEAGVFYVPSIDIEFNDTTLKTEMMELRVETVAVDTSKGIYDIQPNYKVDYSLGEKLNDYAKEYAVWFLLLLIPVLFYFVRRWMKKRKSAETIAPPAPKIPAHIPALEKLRRLESKQEWKIENKKAYYSELTDTVRKYLEDRFDIYAMEQTTREIIQNLLVADISEEDKIFLRQILSNADMVKFAKFKPSDENGLEALQKSIEFVERTKKEGEDNV